MIHDLRTESLKQHCETCLSLCVDTMVDTLQCSSKNDQSGDMAKVRGQYSRIWVCGWALNLQVHSHVAFLSIIQPVGPQAEMHLRGPFNLRIQ